VVGWVINQVKYNTERDGTDADPTRNRWRVIRVDFDKRSVLPTVGGDLDICRRWKRNQRHPTFMLRMLVKRLAKMVPTPITRKYLCHAWELWCICALGPKAVETHIGLSDAGFREDNGCHSQVNW
jgi:hypothetical protein